MCTAICYGNRFFGRTLDYERSFGESLILAPRNCLTLDGGQAKYTAFGVGVIDMGEILFFDGVNECGLGGAALNFRGYAHYHNFTGGRGEVDSSRLISYVLGSCRNVGEARDFLSSVRLTREEGRESSPLHWIFSDGRESIVYESEKGGAYVRENPVGILTNSPSLDYHLTRLADYANLTDTSPRLGQNHSNIKLYSRGLGAFGLPGDFSSSSRFVRAHFVRENIREYRQNALFDSTNMRDGGVLSFFHILDSVSVPNGCVVTDEGRDVLTLYSSCIDLTEQIYYFKSYNSPTIRGVKLTQSLCRLDEIKTMSLYKAEPIKLCEFM